jgi:glycosyltransferase involved in cell wall biosynthesis
MKYSETSLRICCNALMLPNYLGGIGVSTKQLLIELVKQKPEWEITLLVHNGIVEQFSSIQGIHLNVISANSKWTKLFYLHFLFPFHSGRFNIVHSIGNMGIPLCRADQIITINDTYEKVSSARFGVVKRWLMSALVSLSGRVAKVILAISENTAADIRRFYPHLSNKIQVVYLGNRFSNNPHPLKVPEKYFLFVGTLEPGKNLPDVLSAFGGFRKAGGLARLKVVGQKGWERSDIPKMLEQLKINEYVDFLGYVPDDALPGLYAKAIALIVASSYEGFGLPVIEAMACGCPVLVANNSALVESGGKAALFFETGNIKQLVGLMEKINSDLDLRGQCQKLGLEHSTTFSWSRCASQVASVCLSVHRASGAPSNVF